MEDFELSTESDLLLGEDREAVTYAQIAEQSRKVKRLRIAYIVAAVLGLVLLIILLRKAPAFRHRVPPLLKDSPVTQLQPEFFQDYGSKRVQIKYGAFAVPGSGDNNGMQNFWLKDAKLPCRGCLITWMQAGLEFADGSYADATTGMWLHHTLLLNHGRAAIKGCKPSPERFFASGNERTVLDLTLNGTEKTGYWLAESEKVSMTTELMNELKDPRDAYVTITYEYIANMPSDFSTVTSVWLDVGECNGSEVPVPEDMTSFELQMAPWRSTLKGRILMILSHLHDGGVHLDVIKDDEPICRSTATYGNPADYEHKTRGMDMSHISYISGCYDVGRTQEGEDWTVNAHYDLAAHEPMLDKDGKPDGVMGIAVVYVIAD